jgi:hypothetical protein
MTHETAEMALQEILQRLDVMEDRLTQPRIPAEGDLLATEIHLRKMRDSGFPSDYFPNAMWSMLLDLYLGSFSGEGRAEADLAQRLHLGADRMAQLAERLIDDGYAELYRDNLHHITRLRLTRLGQMTMQAVFARTQGRIAELSLAA